MNLWFRLIRVLLSAFARAPLALPHGASLLSFRVWPHDLDISLHMNNGRYLTIMDLGRLDVMLRSGLWRHVMRNGWTPIASSVTTRYRRELRAFQRFRLVTRLLCWDGTLVVMEQTFYIEGGPRHGEVAARALFKGGLYDRSARRFIEIERLMALLGIAASSPPRSPEVLAFLNATDHLKHAGQARSMRRRKPDAGHPADFESQLLQH